MVISSLSIADPEEYFQKVMEILEKLCGADIGFLALKEPGEDRFTIKASYGFFFPESSRERFRLDEGFKSRLAENAGGLVIFDAARGPGVLFEGAGFAKREGLVSGVVACLEIDKACVGMLCVFNRRYTVFSRRSAAALGFIASLVTDKIAKSRVYEDLTETRRRLQEVFDFLPDAAFCIDREGRVTVWNRAAQEMTGVKPEDIIGKGNYELGMVFYGERRPVLADLVLEEDFEKSDSYLKFKADHARKLLTATNYCPGIWGGKGGYLWGQAGPLCDREGRLLGAIEIIRDVSDYIKAQERAQETQRRLADIIDLLPDPTLVIDTEGKVIFWNRGIEELTGVPASQMLGKGDYEYAIPFYGERRPILIDLVLSWNEEFASKYTIIKREKNMLVAETKMPRVKGQARILWGKATPLYDSEGRLVGAIESIRDVTEKHEAEQAVRRSLERVRATFEGVVHALSTIVEIRDPYTAGHQRRVAEISCRLGRFLGLDENRLRVLRTAAMLHDIGKVHIPNEILSKPGRLTDIETLMVRVHPQAAADILRKIPFEEDIATIVLQHHERLDGSGYPSGLKGGQIVLEARILAVADVLEAMSSHRPYRPSLGVAAALEELERNKGILYDPEVVEAAKALFGGMEELEIPAYSSFFRLFDADPND